MKLERAILGDSFGQAELPSRKKAKGSCEESPARRQAIEALYDT
jgi:hypothetical protein